MALSHENKQEIARLVISSLRKHHLQLPVGSVGGRSQHDPPQQLSTTKPPSANTRSKKKRVVKRPRRKNSSGGCEQPRGRQQARNNPDALAAETGRGSYEYSSSSDRTNRSGGRAACFQRQQEHASGVCNNPDDGERLASMTTVIRQRVESREHQAEVSLDGLWLPSLPASSRHLGSSSGVAAATPELSLGTEPGGAVRVGAGDWPRSSNSATMPSSSPPFRTRRNENFTIQSGSGALARSGVGPEETEEGRARGRRGVKPLFASDGDGVRNDDNDRGRTSPAPERFPREAGREGRRWEEDGGAGDTPGNISQDTATMLEISRALVARAKVSTGVRCVSLGRLVMSGVAGSSPVMFACLPHSRDRRGPHVANAHRLHSRRVRNESNPFTLRTPRESLRFSRLAPAYLNIPRHCRSHRPLHRRAAARLCCPPLPQIVAG